MGYKLAIFDLDGTLLDTTQGVIECVENTAKEIGFPRKDMSELITFIGPPLQDSFQRVYGCDKDKADEATAIFRKFYSGGLMYHAKPYDGILEQCEHLKDAGVLLAVATYKKEEYHNLYNRKGVTYSQEVLCPLHKSIRNGDQITIHASIGEL